MFSGGRGRIVEPFRHSVEIPRPQEEAFFRFTTEIASWWPMGTRPPGRSRTGAVVFDEGEGGRIFHREKNGDITLWGTVEAWDPPNRVAFSFHPGRPESEAQRVEVTFEALGEERTRVTLVDSGWTGSSPRVAVASDRLETGWEPVLGRYAGVD
jgi:hypothetical protein